MMTRVPETGCCPRFDPKPWQEKTITWKGKKFVKDRIHSVFHIPLDFGKVMVRDMALIQRAKAEEPQTVVLSDENSPWGVDIYIAAKKDVPGAEMTTITGTFLSKVFEGSFKEMGNWIKEMNGYVEGKGKKAKKLYFYYTTCPKCAKAYGKNYVVLLAEV